MSFNLNYITSPPGVFKILEMLFGLLCWALTAGLSPGRPALQFVMFVSVTSWILTVFTFIVYVLALHASTCSGVPWKVIEFVHNLFWAVLYLIAASVSAAFAHNIPILVAATVFAFFTTIVYVIHVPVSYMEWRGLFPWQSAPSGVSVNT